MKISSLCAIQHLHLYFKQLSENDYLQTQRKEQNIGWFDNLLREGMLQAFLSQEGKLQELKLLREAVASGNIDPQSAAKKLLSL